MRRQLHALFLHYCLLGGYDAKHWPPRMLLPQWVAFLRDAGVAASQRGSRRRCAQLVALFVEQPYPVELVTLA